MVYDSSDRPVSNVCTDQVIVRLWHAISRPPQVGLKVDVGKLMCKINEVKEELNIKLNERVRDMQYQLQGMSVMLTNAEL